MSDIETETETEPAPSIFDEAVPIPEHIKNAPVVGHDEETGEELVEYMDEFLGRPMKGKATRLLAAQLEEGKRRREAAILNVLYDMVKARKLYRSLPSDTTRKAYLERVYHACYACNSHERAERIYGCIARETPEIFWPVFLNMWSMCDASGPWALELLKLMRANGSARPYMEDVEEDDELPSNVGTYDALPELVEVWRGCDRRRVKSIAWTTSEKTAAHFATGMRGGPHRDPVLAHGFIPKDAIFFCENGRNEAEIVLDPKRLQKLTVRPSDDGKDSLRHRKRPKDVAKAAKKQNRKSTYRKVPDWRAA